MIIKKIVSTLVFCGCFSLLPLISGCAAEEVDEGPVEEDPVLEAPDGSDLEEGPPPALE